MNNELLKPPRKIEQTSSAICPFCNREIYREYQAEVWNPDINDYELVEFVRGTFWKRDDGPRYPVCSCPTAKKHPITEAVADIVRPLDKG